MVARAAPQARSAMSAVGGFRSLALAGRYPWKSVKSVVNKRGRPAGRPFRDFRVFRGS